MKMQALVILGVAILQVFTVKKVIWDEQISNDRYIKRLETFNEWYNTKLNPSSKVYARLTEDHMRIGLYAKETLQVNKTKNNFIGR
jgi:hypothetical protein